MEWVTNLSAPKPFTHSISQVEGDETLRTKKTPGPWSGEKFRVHAQYEKERAAAVWGNHPSEIEENSFQKDKKRASEFVFSAPCSKTALTPLFSCHARLDETL
ncbi:MAG TPA: hypothetical protein VFB72_14400 [Verrucomicrobiae bacterium]|nr:hypothetical protein [Verrucomicrobiae bacterium]